jgi:hypothetical protein
MKMTQRELHHVMFLTNVVLSEKKVHLMEDTIRCLTFIVKSIEEVELSDAVSENLQHLIETIEMDFKEENDRIQNKTKLF